MKEANYCHRQHNTHEYFIRHWSSNEYKQNGKHKQTKLVTFGTFYEIVFSFEMLIT